MLTDTGTALLEKTAIVAPLRVAWGLGSKLMTKNLKTAIPNAYRTIKAPIATMWSNRKAAPMFQGGITKAYGDVTTGLKALPQEQLTSMRRLGTGMAATGLMAAGYNSGNKAYREEEDRVRRLQEHDRYMANMSRAQGY